MKLLITGAKGFLGKNLIETLRAESSHEILAVGRDTSFDTLSGYTAECDFVFHLAGVNRPENEEDFYKGNAGFTEELIDSLSAHDRKVPILFSSSTQAGLNNAYGTSKRMAEEKLFLYGKENAVPVYVLRLPNIFGKWSRPEYNSVVATFCHHIARDLPIRMDDPNSILRLTHVDDVVKLFLRILEKGITLPPGEFVTYPNSRIYETTLGELERLIRSFRDGRDSLELPNLSDPFTQKLYSTYISFLPDDAFSYTLDAKCDARGSFTEFIRTPDRGQVSVNVCHPGITKGNHWHHSKHEKYLVVSGTALIRFRRLSDSRIIEYRVSGEKMEVVDIPPGYVHSITNVGEKELVTLMWANESFDKERPDTFPEEV